MNRRQFVLVTGAAASSGFGRSSETAPLDQVDYSAVAFAEGPHEEQLKNTHAVLMSLSDDSMLKPFREREKLPAPGEDLGGWYGTDAFAPAHAFGQWMSALARYYAITGDPATHAKVLGLVRGYAATISPEGKFYVHNRFPAYTYDKLVCGLTDAHAFADDREASGVLLRTTAAAAPHLPPRAIPRVTRPITPEEEFSLHGWDESYTMPENLLIASERSKRTPYREMAVRFLADKDYFDPLANGQNVLAGRHAYSHVNALSSAAKAYLALGERKYLRAAQNGFDFVQQQSFATGGWGPDELFSPPGSNALAESLEKTHASFETPCGAYAHFKITRYLLRITRDSRYGDSMERVMYNTVLGAKPLQADGRTFYYSDYHNGGHKNYHPDKWPCCAGTLPQIAADYRISTYFRDQDGIFVNLYIPSTLRWNQGDTRVALTQSGPYPRRGEVRMKLEMPKPVECTLRFRIPAWTAGRAALYVNGRRQAGEVQSGRFAAIQRTWRSGDHVELELPCKRRLEPVDAKHRDVVALLEGPLVLFSPSEKPLELTSGELLKATGLVPFMELQDQPYCAYQRLTTTRTAAGTRQTAAANRPQRS